MELRIKSPKSVGDTTISPLTVDGKLECEILEDKVREVPGKPVSQWKIPAVTAIPSGRYKVTITWSGRFGKMLPLLNDVPGFSGVRIHGGNTKENTEGCLLPGTKLNDHTVVNSQAALKPLQAKIQAALDKGEPVYITIERTL